MNAGMRFESPLALALVILAPLALWGMLRARRTGAVAFPGAALAAALPLTWRARLARPVPALLRLGAIVLLAVAVARPQHGIGHVRTSTDAVAIQLVVDRSGSMAEPMMFGGERSTKIDVVKRVLGDFVLGDKKDLAGRPADLIGLVSFAGLPETVCPLVQDGKAVVELAKTIKLARVQGPEAGTAIGDALELAAARLKREDELRTREGRAEQDAVHIKSKVIVLLTDGQNNRGEHEPLEAAALAAKWGIRVHTIGIGGSVPPGEQPGSVFGGLIMQMGEDFDEPTLKKIAEMTGGIYRRASDSEALRKVYAEIDSLEKTKVQTVTFTDYDERFTPLAAAAGAAVLLELVLSCTLLRRVP